MTTSASRPSRAARTASSWPGRKSRKPKCWWREPCKSIGPATLAPDPAVMGAIERPDYASSEVVTEARRRLPHTEGRDSGRVPVETEDARAGHGRQGEA